MMVKLLTLLMIYSLCHDTTTSVSQSFINVIYKTMYWDRIYLTSHLNNEKLRRKWKERMRAHTNHIFLKQSWENKRSRENILSNETPRDESRERQYDTRFEKRQGRVGFFTAAKPKKNITIRDLEDFYKTLFGSVLQIRYKFIFLSIFMPRFSSSWWRIPLSRGVWRSYLSVVTTISYPHLWYASFTCLWTHVITRFERVLLVPKSFNISNRMNG